ncbi:SPOR domain-containing protein [Saccharothrix xinjiangensis]|uniref:SPOR domain-containing protein n=1 Tax=Saccharothrix xinjiangensis TaxID=204798 RepID=A0ABV9XS94_9PSEU
MSGVTALTLTLLPLFVLGVLALVLYWAFGNDRRGVPDHTGHDFGLLVQVAATPTVEAADVLAARLRRAGIRVTVVRRGGAHLLLVFPADAPDAKLLLS